MDIYDMIDRYAQAQQLTSWEFQQAYRGRLQTFIEWVMLYVLELNDLMLYGFLTDDIATQTQLRAEVAGLTMAEAALRYLTNRQDYAMHWLNIPFSHYTFERLNELLGFYDTRDELVAEFRVIALSLIKLKVLGS